ncbi:hypothetical protein ACT8ZV_19170 [Nocardioides sp. MAHUQ-72]|uniref:hypothetical protein n=1 Tax=unclassified Nocardioides TaxID=2615069 RepID=UPI003618EE5B
MQPDSEDEAWRAIVENYGDRPELDDVEPAQPAPGPSGDVDLPEREPAREPEPEPEAERFVPPPPPPLPHVTPDRLVAWGGVFGAPAILLVALLAGLHFTSWIGYLLVAWFVGGFVYLVVRMPREPRDPFDDGARL